MDAALCVDLVVVGEPEDLREELGQAQAGANLGDEARRLVGFDGEGVGRVGRDEERLAGAYPSAGAADAAGDLALEDLKTLFLEPVAVQRSGAAAGRGESARVPPLSTAGRSSDTTGAVRSASPAGSAV